MMHPQHPECHPPSVVSRHGFLTNVPTEEITVPQNATCHCLKSFHKFLNKLFYKIGYLIATSPSYFILIPLFLTLFGLTGIQKLTYEKDPEFLFSPTTGEGRREREILETFFPINYSYHFDPSRLTRISHFARLLVLCKDNTTMLKVDAWNELVLLDEAVRNITITWEDDTYTYTDVCAKMNNECLENQIFNLNEFIPEIDNGSLLLNYPIMLYPLVLPFFFGGPVVNESEGVLTSAEAVSLNYWFRDDDWKQKQRAHLFEGKMLELLDTTEFKHISVSRFVSRSLEDELDANAQAITPYLGWTVFLLISFTIGSLFTTDWVRSKISIGILGVLTTVFATIASFGLLMYCQVPFIGINMAAPFLMLGIGIDDMFVILSAWQRTKLQDQSVATRLGKTYSEAAVSITITSLTNMLSFFIGTFTPFPSVRIFCTYTGLAIVFTYIWQITFFGACLAIAGKQEKKQRHNVTCFKVVSKSEAEKIGCCYSFWCAGGINPLDPWNPKDNRKRVISRFFKDYFGKALNIPLIKAFVVGIFLIYLAGAIYGCTMVKEGLERRRLTLDSSYLVDFFDNEDRLFRHYPYRIQVIIAGNLTYSDPETKKNLLELHDKFENLKYIGPKLYTQSWIRGFYRFLDRRVHLKANITDEASFIKILKSEYLVPTTPEYLDLVFNENETRIVASRFVIQGFEIKDTNGDKDMMLEVRRVAHESPYQVTAFHPFFVYFDQYLLVKYTSMQTILSAAVLMMVVSLIFIPNPLCSLWVAFSIISIEVGVIGYMSLWGVNLDSVSMINLIMCIGFSVDFSAHISYAYLTAGKNSPDDRVRECLYNLGLPVLQGGLSTIAGVVVLEAAPSYIFTTFFKIVFLVIFFGITHALLLLPVMLSILGPGSCQKAKEEDSGPVIIAVSELCPHNDITKDNTILDTPKVLKTGDEESLDRDLGLGSSESSSRSSLHEADCVPPISDTESVTTHSRHNSSRKPSRGRRNDGFIADDDIITEKL